jgi:Concanavalin A-like lectin/glucanases superfamily
METGSLIQHPRSSYLLIALGLFFTVSSPFPAPASDDGLTAPQTRVFDVSADFSLVANPNGVWSFGRLVGLDGPFEVLPNFSTFGAENGVPIAVWRRESNHKPFVAKVLGPGTAVSYQFNGPAGTVYFGPDPDSVPEDFAAIRFTVPPDGGGSYDLTTAVRSLYDSMRSTDADFHVLRNGHELFAQHIPANSSASYSHVLDLLPGDRIDFAAGRGSGNTDTGLKIQATLAHAINPPPPPPPATNCVPAPAGLAAWWPFNGDAHDVRSGHMLQLSGGPVFTTGQVGGALQFDGVDDQAIAPASPALDVGVGDGFSIEAWVNPSHVTLQPIAEWTAGPGTTGVHFWIGVYGSGSLFANLIDTGNFSHSWRSDTNLVVPNQWQHVAMSYQKSPGLLRFYLNGLKVTEYLLGPLEPQTSFPLAIGYRPEQDHFAGRIDELSVYRRVLSDTEMAAIYAAGSQGKCPGPPPQDNVYDLSQGYSTASNPSGPWSFGWKETVSSSQFSLLTYGKSLAAENGVPIFSWQVAVNQPPSLAKVIGPGTAISAQGQFTAPPGTVYFTAGLDDSIWNFGVIRFTVPPEKAGNYVVATTVRDEFDGSFQGDTDFHIARNGVEIFSRALPPHATASFTDTLNLAAGDSIDFLVGRGEDGHQAGSGLKITVTLTLAEPPPPPPEPPHCVAPAEGLVAWWPAEQNPNDVAGTNRGTLLGGAGYGPGQVGRAFAFPGGESGVKIPASPELDVGAGPGFTIEGWINPADLSKRGPLVEWNRGGSDVVEWGVHLCILRPDEYGLGAGNLVANLTDAFGVSHFVKAPGGTVTANTWQHIALTYDRESGAGRLYCNGAIVAEANLGHYTPETSYDLYLGRRPAGDAVLSYHGLLDEISIYNRALSETEIHDVYSAGAAGKCRTPSALDELIQLVQGIPSPVNPQPLLASLEAVRASIQRGNLRSAIHQLGAFQNKVRAQIGGLNPSLSARIIADAQFIIETLDPTGARRQDLLALVDTPMRIERVQRIDDSGSPVWWVQGCGCPGIVCCVQRSLNLRDWEHAGFAVEVDDGVFEWMDPSTDQPETVFYRLLEP